jgi:hypothetical protein
MKTEKNNSKLAQVLKATMRDIHQQPRVCFAAVLMMEKERGRGELKEAGTEDRSDFRFWVGEKMFLARLAIEACHLTQLEDATDTNLMLPVAR